MEYQKIMCEFCKECTKFEVNKKVVNPPYESKMLVVKCENFCPKLTFKSNAKECCSFFRDYDESEANDEQVEDRICRY